MRSSRGARAPWLRTQEFRVALGFRPPFTMKGCLNGWTGPMKVGESRPGSARGSAPVSDPEDGPGVKTPQVERRRAACPQGTRHRR